MAWENFTPVSASLGGALIGLAAALLWLANGRIAGISGIVAGIGKPAKGEGSWRVAFVLGMLAAPGLSALATGSLPRITIGTSLPTLALAGLLVGFGTRLGSGCTSGHGVCGIARLSRRSLAATLVFMAAGMATVFVVRHLAGE
ncbi:MAG TPA: YeeE/YedE family protein [Alphaproteobacteria bacterium]|nr:YeeE/YedE family protein [Alphaproteobacteria bacterium]